MFPRWPWLNAPARGVTAPAMRDWIEKISPCETPHTGGAGDLREYDSFATSQLGDRHGLRCICRLHRPASPRWRPAGVSAASGTPPTSGAFQIGRAHV